MNQRPALPGRRAALLCVLFAGSVMAPSASWAKKKSSKKTGGSSSAKVQRSSSEESRAERERRLTRECRGRHNAGACLGYGG